MKLGPERRNAVKVLLFLDVGGSMDWHVEAAEQLFSSAQSQFKRLDHFYFTTAFMRAYGKTTAAGMTSALRRGTSSIPTEGTTAWSSSATRR